MQHDSNDFVKYSGASRADMLAANISLSADVDISDTGLTGFMRDNGENTFTGTLTGNSHKLTMTVGKENKIVFHTHNGLFAKTSGAKISNIKIVSNLNIVGDNVSGGDACYIGSVSAYNSGALTIDSVTADVTASPSGDFTNFVGGLVGCVTDVASATTDISFNNCTLNVTLKYNSTKANDCTVLGGVIGIVDGAKTEITKKIVFDEVTVKGSIEDKHTGSNARVGGLIAEVKAVDDKGLKTNTTICNKIDIKKVDINGLTITTKVNKTGSTSGGFLGHNWYRVKVTLSDLKISNSKLNVSSYELGGLVLSTTGYWNVKTIHFANDVKISNSRCFRFGMLSGTLFGRSYDSYGFDYMNAINYNKAICGSDATYFELTGIGDKGYVIDDSTELSLSKCEYFDEITRSSIYGDAANPVSGQNAIISIPAVTDSGERLLYTDGKNCNTYQNQTKKTKATPLIGNQIQVQGIIIILMYTGQIMLMKQAELKLLYGVQEFLRRQT